MTITSIKIFFSKNNYFVLKNGKLRKGKICRLYKKKEKNHNSFFSPRDEKEIIAF